VKTPREVSTDDPLDVSSLSCALAVATLILFDNVVARATQESVGFPAAAGWLKSHQPITCNRKLVHCRTVKVKLRNISILKTAGLVVLTHSHTKPV